MFTAQLITDRATFAQQATPFLLHNEAQHNLLLGLIDTIVNHPDVYPTAHLAIARNDQAQDDQAQIVGIALQTPPHPLQVSHFSDLGALAAVARAWLPHQVDVKAINGFLKEVETLAAHWCNLTGQMGVGTRPQLLYRLDTVAMPASVPGNLRLANMADYYRVVDWLAAFEADAFGADRPDRPNANLAAQRFLSEPGRGMALWEVGGVPVAMAGWGAITRHGVRISAVYTPNEQRGKGYAKAVTAALSHYLMTRHSRAFCVLYTDAANPISNAAYRRIGYYPIAEAIQISIGDTSS